MEMVTYKTSGQSPGHQQTEGEDSDDPGFEVISHPLDVEGDNEIAQFEVISKDEATGEAAREKLSCDPGQRRTEAIHPQGPGIPILKTGLMSGSTKRAPSCDSQTRRGDGVRYTCTSLSEDCVAEEANINDLGPETAQGQNGSSSACSHQRAAAVGSSNGHGGARPKTSYVDAVSVAQGSSTQRAGLTSTGGTSSIAPVLPRGNMGSKLCKLLRIKKPERNLVHSDSGVKSSLPGLAVGESFSSESSGQSGSQIKTFDSLQACIGSSLMERQDSLQAKISQILDKEDCSTYTSGANASVAQITDSDIPSESIETHLTVTEESEKKLENNPAEEVLEGDEPILIDESDYPRHLCPSGHFDVVILHSEEDFNAAYEFKEDLIKNIILDHGEPPKICIQDDDDYLVWIRSRFSFTEESLKRGTFIFLYLTCTFLDDRWGEIQREECLMETVHNEKKKWSIIPVHTQAKKDAKYKVPFGFRSLNGINAAQRDKFFYKRVRNMLNERRGLRLQREKEVAVKLEKWIEEETHKRRQQREEERHQKRMEEKRRKQERICQSQALKCDEINVEKKLSEMPKFSYQSKVSWDNKPQCPPAELHVSQRQLEPGRVPSGHSERESVAHYDPRGLQQSPSPGHYPPYAGPNPGYTPYQCPPYFWNFSNWPPGDSMPPGIPPGYADPRGMAAGLVQGRAPVHINAQVVHIGDHTQSQVHAAPDPVEEEVEIITEPEEPGMHHEKSCTSPQWPTHSQHWAQGPDQSATPQYLQYQGAVPQHPQYQGRGQGVAPQYPHYQGRGQEAPPPQYPLHQARGQGVAPQYSQYQGPALPHPQYQGAALQHPPYQASGHDAQVSQSQSINPQSKMVENYEQMPTQATDQEHKKDAAQSTYGLVSREETDPSKGASALAPGTKNPAPSVLIHEARASNSEVARQTSNIVDGPATSLGTDSQQDSRGVVMPTLSGNQPQGAGGTVGVRRTAVVSPVRATPPVELQNLSIPSPGSHSGQSHEVSEHASLDTSQTRVKIRASGSKREPSEYSSGGPAEGMCGGSPCPPQGVPVSNASQHSPREPREHDEVTEGLDKLHVSDPHKHKVVEDQHAGTAGGTYPCQQSDTPVSDNVIAQVNRMIAERNMAGPSAERSDSAVLTAETSAQHEFKDKSYLNNAYGQLSGDISAKSGATIGKNDMPGMYHNLRPPDRSSQQGQGHSNQPYGQGQTIYPSYSYQKTSQNPAYHPNFNPNHAPSVPYFVPSTHPNMAPSLNNLTPNTAAQSGQTFMQTLGQSGYPPGNALYPNAASYVAQGQYALGDARLPGQPMIYAQGRGVGVPVQHRWSQEFMGPGGPGTVGVQGGGGLQGVQGAPRIHDTPREHAPQGIPRNLRVPQAQENSQPPARFTSAPTFGPWGYQSQRHTFGPVSLPPPGVSHPQAQVDPRQLELEVDMVDRC